MLPNFTTQYNQEDSISFPTYVVMISLVIVNVIISLNPLSCQNYIEIHPANGRLTVKYFYPIDEFTNPVHGVVIAPNEKYYYIPDTKNIKNKMVGFMINDIQIELFLGIKDSIRICFDAKNNNYSISGNNSSRHENYNKLKTEYRSKRLYEDLFDYNNNNGIPVINVLEDIKQKVLYERENIQNCMRIDLPSTLCDKTLLTTFDISMLLWIKEGFPKGLLFEDYFQDILRIFDFDRDVVKGCMNGFLYFNIYFSTSSINVFNNTLNVFDSNWLNQYNYLLNAPTGFRDYLLQCNYIIYANSGGEFLELCGLFSEMKIIFDKIYFTSFFDNHHPCP